MMNSLYLTQIRSFISFIHLRLKLINGHIVTLRDNSLIKLPRPSKNKVILESLKISNIAGHDQAIEFVKKFNTGKYTDSLHILKANRDIEHEETWLNHINSYFSSFDMAPLKLKNIPGTRFQRLDSDVTSTSAQKFLVSVIITAFNSEETIKHSIESILNQSWKKLEVIIIDDNSTDSTWEIISKNALSDNRIKAFKNTINVGSYVSKNIALKMISGKYFTCHDSDDWSHPERISKQVTKMLHEKANASIILMLRAKHSMQITRLHKVNKSCIDGIGRYSLISCMFDTDYFKENLGGWDTVRISADSELYERANILLGKNFKKYKILGLICLDSENSLTNHPIYGTNLPNKKTSPRKKYILAFRFWHKTLKNSSAYLEFPQSKRNFEAPNISLTPNSDIKKLLTDYQLNSDTDNKQFNKIS